MIGFLRETETSLPVAESMLENAVTKEAL